MKLRTPFYDGDSIVRDGPAPEIEANDAASVVGHGKDMTQCTNDPVGAEPGIAGIEARARRLRIQTIARYYSDFWSWLGAQLERTRQRAEEKYLARARNAVELERRLRRIEREGRLIHT